MPKFDYFIILAEMRTGSNFLETNLNQLDGITCHGEAFNPAFIGYPKTDKLLGISLRQREESPQDLLDAIRDAPGLGGFRFFNNHDPRVLEICLSDPRCAKIILNRNPIDSFVSLQIARQTGQWKLTNAAHVKSQQIMFDADEFERHLETTDAFKIRVNTALQKSGQTAFHLSYEDLQDVDVINGLAAYLGVAGRIAKLDRKLKKQNPQSLSDKVTNYAEMEKALARLDRFDLNRVPNFEPRRGPAIPTYVAAPRSGLLYIPLRSGSDDVVFDWMARLDDAPQSALQHSFNQKSLRGWMRAHPGFRSFALLRHPVARAHAVFCDRILFDGPDSFPEIRATLRKLHKLPIPEGRPDGRYDTAAHRRAFLAFLRFLRSNLSGQTGVRIDPSWASQLTLLQGVSQFLIPDIILRDDDLHNDLAFLAAQVGAAGDTALADTRHSQHDLLAAIYTADIEKAARDAYARDYLSFGFGNWA